MELALLLFSDYDVIDAFIALALPAFELQLFMKIFFPDLMATYSLKKIGKLIEVVKTKQTQQ